LIAGAKVDFRQTGAHEIIDAPGGARVVHGPVSIGNDAHVQSQQRGASYGEQ
jgi:hypothetical protein